MKILVINGPNLNMLGIREPELYGRTTYDDLISMIEDHCEKKNIEVKCLQSNHEGDLVDFIQGAFFDGTDGIVINPGASLRSKFISPTSMRENLSGRCLIYLLTALSPSSARV